jgi:hypothetical protein
MTNPSGLIVAPAVRWLAERYRTTWGAPQYRLRARSDALAAAYPVVFVDELGRYVEELPD